MVSLPVASLVNVTELIEEVGEVFQLETDLISSSAIGLREQSSFQEPLGGIDLGKTGIKPGLGSRPLKLNFDLEKLENEIKNSIGLKIEILEMRKIEIRPEGFKTVGDLFTSW